MRFITFSYKGETLPGVLSRDGHSVVSFRQAKLPFASVNDLICNASPAQMADLKRLSREPENPLPLEQVKLLAPLPVPRQDVICLGINYAAHAPGIGPVQEREPTTPTGSTPSIFPKGSTRP